MTTVCYVSRHYGKQGGDQSILQCHIILASSHTSLMLFLMISNWRGWTSLVAILLNLHLALARTFKFAKMSDTLAPGKHWTMVAAVSILTLRKIHQVSQWVSHWVENLFNVLIGTEERCFDPRLCHQTVAQLPCCGGSATGTKQCTGLPELVASKAVSKALTFLLSSIKVGCVSLAL